MPDGLCGGRVHDGGGRRREQKEGLLATAGFSTSTLYCVNSVGFFEILHGGYTIHTVPTHRGRLPVPTHAYSSAVIE